MALSWSLPTLNSCGLSPCRAPPMLNLACDVGYRSQEVSTATSIRLSEIGVGLFHFIFETLTSLFERLAPNELQYKKRVTDNNERGRRKESKDAVVPICGTGEGIVCQSAIDPCRSDCICYHRGELKHLCGKKVPNIQLIIMPSPTR